VKSQRQIANDMCGDRKTVKRYVDRYYNARNALMNNVNNKVINERELIDDIVAAPKYNSFNRKKYKLIDEIIGKIEIYLKENEKKRATGQSRN